MADQVSRAASGRDGTGTALYKLIPIESVGDRAPFRIVPLVQHHGTAVPAEEVMAAKVKWACAAGYQVLTEKVPKEFAPFNAVIRVSTTGTEDRNRDYLAQLAGPAVVAGQFIRPV